MSASVARDDTVVPTEEDSRVAAESRRVLASAAIKEREMRVRLENGQTLVLPQGVSRLLSHLLTEMGRGNAVTLITTHAELTTQEAADYLNVSRPFLIRLLEQGQIKFHKTGTHRRVRFTDLVAFKARAEEESERALAELAAQGQDLKMGH